DYGVPFDASEGVTEHEIALAFGLPKLQFRPIAVPLVRIASGRRHGRHKKYTQVIASFCVLGKVKQCIDRPPLNAGINIEPGDRVEDAELCGVEPLTVDHTKVVGISRAAETKGASEIRWGREALGSGPVSTATVHLILRNRVRILEIIIGGIGTQLHAWKQLPAGLDLSAVHVIVCPTAYFQHSGAKRNDGKVVQEIILPIPRNRGTSALWIKIVVPCHLGAQPGIAEFSSGQRKWFEVMRVVGPERLIDGDRFACVKPRQG